MRDLIPSPTLKGDTAARKEDLREEGLSLIAKEEALEEDLHREGSFCPQALLILFFQTLGH